MNTDAVSTSDILLDNNDHRNEDDERTGVLDHPLKGKHKIAPSACTGNLLLYSLLALFIV